MRDADAVLNELRTKAPQLLRHIVPDRDWLWYCGPELRGEDNAATREILKDAGFIWAKGGHEVETEDGDVLMGSWGHCCAKPVKFRRRGEKNESTDDSTTTSESDPFAALAELNVA